MSSEKELLPECPFFRFHKRNYVECEGMDDHSILRSHYDLRTSLDAHLERYCCSMNYSSCPVGKMLFAKYED